MAIIGRKALVKVSGTSTAMTAEATTNTGDNKTYQITATAKRVIDPTATITVKVGGITTAESYTLNRLVGKITFALVDAGRAAVTVDGNYLPMSNAAQAKEYSWTLEAENAEDTEFQDVWKTRVQALLNFSGSLGKWYVDGYFIDALRNDDIKMLEIYADNSVNPDVRAWVRLTSAVGSASVDGLVEKSIDFEGVFDNDRRVVAV